MSKTKTEKGRRRPLFETPEELQAAVDEYFKACEGTPVYDKKGRPVIGRDGRQLRAGGSQPTLTGLALFCGYSDRRVFTRQRERSAAFNDVVLAARSRLEDYWEQALYNDATFYGAQYMLIAAFGWGREDFKDADATPPRKVRIINRAPKNDGGDPSIMSATVGKLMN